MVKRRVFYSFHYDNDNWVTQQIKQIGSVDKQVPSKLFSNQWESVKLKGDRAIKNWIDGNIKGCSCLVVLIGQETANRKYVLYEIEKAWNSGKGVLGIYVHHLKNSNQVQGIKGKNPFDRFSIDCPSNILLQYFNPPTYDYDLNCRIQSDIFKSDSQNWYKIISHSLNEWVENAINFRKIHDFEIELK